MLFSQPASVIWMEVFTVFPFWGEYQYIFFSLCVTGEYDFNIYNLKVSGGMHFLAHICSIWINPCQINFKGGSLDFDLVPSCWDCGWVPLIHLWAVSLHLTDTKPTPKAPCDKHVCRKNCNDIMQMLYISVISRNLCIPYNNLKFKALIQGHEWRNTINLLFTFWY